jgi:hypothetical protein
MEFLIPDFRILPRKLKFATELSCSPGAPRCMQIEFTRQPVGVMVTREAVDEAHSEYCPNSFSRLSLHPIPHVQMFPPTRSSPQRIPRETAVPSCQAGAQAQQPGPYNNQYAPGKSG